MNVDSLLPWTMDPRWCVNFCLILLHSLWVSAIIYSLTVGIDWLLPGKSVKGRHRLHVVSLLSVILMLPLIGWLAVDASPATATPPEFWISKLISQAVEKGLAVASLPVANSN